MVNGWAAGGGHSLHVVCDLTIASREHARFKQTDADVGSFDAGYGSAYLAKMVGQKFAREIFFLGRTYSAEDMHRMGAVNIVADHTSLESEALQVAREIMGKSPQAQRMLKFAFNLVDDGLMGQQVFAGEATRLAYMTDEAVEGRDQFLEKRDPTGRPSPGTSDRTGMPCRSGPSSTPGPTCARQTLRRRGRRKPPRGRLPRAAGQVA